MPIAPVVNGRYLTAQGVLVTIVFRQPPDDQQREFIGHAKINGDFATKLYRANGVCPGDGAFNLNSIAPAEETTTYNPLIQQADETWRPLAQFFGNLNSVRVEWRNKTRWAQATGKDEQGNPTLTLIDLDAG